MNERYQEVLEQYEVEILSVRKGRGAWICETDKGLKLLREYKGTVRRLEFEIRYWNAWIPGEVSGQISMYVTRKELF